VSLREGPYAAAWRRYRRWRWTFWLLFVLYLPAPAILSRAMGWTRGSGTPIVVAAFAWMIAFARRCLHCGLPKWAGHDPGPHEIS
jgi:hypothetical protein